MRPVFAAGVLLACCTVPLRAQDNLRSTITQLFTFGDCGAPLCLELGNEHENHFIPAVTASNQTVIAFITEAIGKSVANTPISATSSGTTFSLVGGLPVRSSTSMGPIFGERAQTLGRGRFFVGANVTGLSLTTLNGTQLDNILINFAHQDVGNPGLGDPEFENDVIQLRMSLDMNITVASVFATWGILDFVDLGVAVPIVRTSITGFSQAQVLPFGNSTVHNFGGAPPILRATSNASGTATGLGDVVGRLKINLGQSRTFGAALLTDVRFSTGNEKDLLGAGSSSVRALGIASAQFGEFAPHLNVGYLARTGDLTNDAFLATLGFDQLVAPWATFAAELISEWQIGADKISLPRDIHYVAPLDRTIPAISVPRRRDNVLNAAVGIKFNVRGGTVLVLNGIVPVRRVGLQPDFIWTVGLEGTL
ncbi:MAG: hypothetical protein AB7I33_07020 [Gemmatimonadales bacterium]